MYERIQQKNSSYDSRKGELNAFVSIAFNAHEIHKISSNVTNCHETRAEIEKFCSNKMEENHVLASGIRYWKWNTGIEMLSVL